MTRYHLAAALAAVLVLGANTATATPNMTMIVHKDPNCGCCGTWIDHVRMAGFSVEIRNTAAMHEVKADLGVPDDLASCHTAEIAGYVVEGHVPASAIKALLTQRLDVAGLAVPGMPLGSPGMDAPGMTPEPYEVVLFATQDVERQTLGTFVGTEKVR